MIFQILMNIAKSTQKNIGNVATFTTRGLWIIKKAVIFFKHYFISTKENKAWFKRRIYMCRIQLAVKFDRNAKLDCAFQTSNFAWVECNYCTTSLLYLVQEFVVSKRESQIVFDTCEIQRLKRRRTFVA